MQGTLGDMCSLLHLSSIEQQKTTRTKATRALPAAPPAALSCHGALHSTHVSPSLLRRFLSAHLAHEMKSRLDECQQTWHCLFCASSTEQQQQ
jgi:hypothetical protein